MNLIEFYPTPDTLAKKMLDKIKVGSITTILEPSAGMGNLVTALYDKYLERYPRGKMTLDVDVIEIEPTLRVLLKERNLRIVHDNFLTYETFKNYDLIFMNPPFSNGDEHLLKALKIQEKGGKIICLLNAETIKNPYSKKRQVLCKLLEKYNAEIEFLVEEFVSAERKTKVEVALIYVDIPTQINISLFLGDIKLKKSEEELDSTESLGKNSLISNDPISGMVERYNAEANLGANIIREFYSLSNVSEHIKIGYSGLLTLNIKGESTKDPVNRFLNELREVYWKEVFNHPLFRDNLTSNLREVLYNKVQALKEYEFSVFNVQQIFLEVMGLLSKGIEKTILEKFDYMSRHHMNEDSNNIHYFTGWKTNKSWKINKKVIIPMSNCIGGYVRPEVSDYATSTLQDMEKVFDYLDQGTTDHPSDIRTTLEECKTSGNFKNIDTKYFTFSFFKKGTIHMTFKNEELLHKFNLFGSQRKGWLPPSYGKKNYNDMDVEEKEIIDQFEGEASYNKVMCNKGYYLVETDKILQLT